MWETLKDVVDVLYIVLYTLPCNSVWHISHTSFCGITGILNTLFWFDQGWLHSMYNGLTSRLSGVKQVNEQHVLWDILGERKDESMWFQTKKANEKSLLSQFLVRWDITPLFSLTSLTICTVTKMNSLLGLYLYWYFCSSNSQGINAKECSDLLLIFEITITVRLGWLSSSYLSYLSESILIGQWSRTGRIRMKLLEMMHESASKMCCEQRADS